jgi:hypothetical protein
MTQAQGNPGDILETTFTVENVGDTGTQVVELVRLDTGDVVDSKEIGLTAGGSSQFVLEWDTTGAPTDTQYTLRVESVNDTASFDVELGSAIPDSVVDNFEDAGSNTPGVYESGDDLSAYYAGSPDMSAFSRTTTSPAEGSHAVEDTDTSENDEQMVSEPGNGLNRYPDYGDTVAMLIRDVGGGDFASQPGLIYAGTVTEQSGDNEFSGYTARIRAGNNELHIDKYTNATTGGRNVLATGPVSISEGTWYWIEADKPTDGGSSHAVRLYDVDLSGETPQRGSQIGSELTATDSNHTAEQGIGVSKVVDSTGTVADYINIG